MTVEAVKHTLAPVPQLVHEITPEVVAEKYPVAQAVIAVALVHVDAPVEHAVQLPEFKK